MSAAAAAGPALPTLQFLAFDFSLRRVGVATGNSISGCGQPLLTIHDEGDARFTRIARLIAEWRPDALVIGVPLMPDGSSFDNTQRARRFGRQLHGRFRLPVHEVDERYTTVAAEADGASDVDAASAALILDQFLASASAIAPASATVSLVQDPNPAAPPPHPPKPHEPARPPEGRMPGGAA